MVNTSELEKIISSSGIKKYKIAEKLGITTYSLSKKIKNKTEFKASEIRSMATILNISSKVQVNNIFFADTVEFNSTKY